MPTIILTPIPDTTPDTPICVNPGIVIPELSTIFGQTLFNRKRALSIRQNYNPKVQMQIISGAQAVPLNDITPLLRFTEASLATNYKANGTVTILDSDLGTIEFNLPEGVRNRSGVYLAEVGVLDESDNLILANEIYIYVERSSFGSAPHGPPTLDEMKLSLKDSDAFESELLSSTTNALAEIAQAVTRAVQIYNEMPPALTAFRKSTFNFPHRSLWITGASALLFEAMVEMYRKNRLPYTAGGVSIDDQNKLQEYHAAAQQNIQEFKQRSMELKAQANVQRGYGYL